MTTPGIGEALDSVRGKDEVQVERAALELDEVLAALDLGGLGVRQRETEFAYRRDETLPVLGGLLNEQVRVLGGVREAE